MWINQHKLSQSGLRQPFLPLQKLQFTDFSLRKEVERYSYQDAALE